MLTPRQRWPLCGLTGYRPPRRWPRSTPSGGWRRVRPPPRRTRPGRRTHGSAGVTGCGGRLWKITKHNTPLLSKSTPPSRNSWLLAELTSLLPGMRHGELVSEHLTTRPASTLLDTLSPICNAKRQLPRASRITGQVAGEGPHRRGSYPAHHASPARANRLTRSDNWITNVARRPEIYLDACAPNSALSRTLRRFVISG